MKDVLVAGDTLDNEYTVVDFPASAGWTLRLRLIPRASTGQSIELTAQADGDSYRLQIGPSESANWTPGDYSLVRWVEQPGARYSCEPEPLLPRQVTILPNPATVPFWDSRSQARQNLEAIEAFLGGRATNAVQEYEINGRRLVNYKPAELIVLRDDFLRQVRNEDAAARLAAGVGDPRRIRIRFGA